MFQALHKNCSSGTAWNSVQTWPHILFAVTLVLNCGISPARDVYSYHQFASLYHHMLHSRTFATSYINVSLRRKPSFKLRNLWKLMEIIYLRKMLFFLPPVFFVAVVTRFTFKQINSFFWWWLLYFAYFPFSMLLPSLRRSTWIGWGTLVNEQINSRVTRRDLIFLVTHLFFLC